ncbi:TRAP transporter permease [Virgibacillus byunsanensis]|uniref:TRAP transporter permease n=1 Tax=Virgibacillus byunsanensis TaxID=570945 RepID=A0ABW3LNP5_9BACI
MSDIKTTEKINVQEISEGESAGRVLPHTQNMIMTIIAVSMSCFHIIVLGGFYTLNPWILYLTHLGFAIILVFLIYPANTHEKKSSFKLLDIVFVLCAIAAISYYIIDIDQLIYRIGISPNLWDVVAASTIVFLVLEITRRTCGFILPLIAVIFILYAVFGSGLPGILGHSGYSLERIISYLTGLDAIFSTPVASSASFVFLFILFGAFLATSGAGKLFIDLSISLTGGRRGGPAKSAVVASSLFGSFTGSSNANVVASGAFTIPLMKQIGYKPKFSGAVEAVSSTGGQLMPPVMGAAAFIMAELIGIPYLDIVYAAIIPVLLYYSAVFFMIDFEAAKLKLKGIPKSALNQPFDVLKKNGHLAIPLLVLIYMLVIVHSSLVRAALLAILSALVVAALKKETRMGFKKTYNALSQGAKTSLEVIASCATAGLVIGILNLTGLGLKFASLIISFSGGILIIALILTMLSSLLLGMGLPTTAGYLISAAVVAPALVEFGVPVLAAHMFVFYFACLSAITPPVALAAFAASGLASAKPMQVALTSVKLGTVAFIIPFMFVYNPALLGQGSILSIIITIISAFLGTYAIACAIQGWLWKEEINNKFIRILLAISALTLIYPGLTSDILGVGLMVLIIILRNKLIVSKKKDKQNQSKKENDENIG